MSSARNRSQRSDSRRRGVLAVGALGTAGGLALLFHFNGVLGANATATDAAVPGMAPAAAQSSAAAEMPDATPDAMATKAATAKKPKTAKTPAGGAAAMAGGAAAMAVPARTTVLGPAVNTRWGVVQVRLTVQKGKVIAARAVQSPHSSGTSLEINARALPILNGETVKAQNAMIDAVSGATVTSGGYLKSLQSAVDHAHLA